MQVVMKEIFDYFWKADTPFQFFWGRTNFWCSTHFTGVVVFLNWQIWKISLQLRADGPAVTLNVLLAWEHKKELEFF